MIPGVDSDGHDVYGGFECVGKSVHQMNETLIPVFKMVEEHGFKLFTQPRSEGENYFYKRNVKLLITNS